MTHPYTPDCSEDCSLVLRPVPGAQQWPRRLECETHGYPQEKKSSLVVNSNDPEKPNDYVSEVASPADVFEVGKNSFSQY
jgi:hypothetical protein